MANLLYATNNKPWQSRIAIHKIANIAFSETVHLKIFIGNPKCEFYEVDKFFNLLERLNKRSGATVVLAEKPAGSMLAKWQHLNSLAKVEVYYKPRYDDSMSHLCVAGRAYRLESPHKKMPPFAKVSDIFPQRPARFGFNRKADLAALNYYWGHEVFADCSPLEPITD